MEVIIDSIIFVLTCVNILVQTFTDARFASIQNTCCWQIFLGLKISESVYSLYDSLEYFANQRCWEILNTEHQFTKLKIGAPSKTLPAHLEIPKHNRRIFENEILCTVWAHIL